MISRTPFVFPSLGPTAFLFFFTPRAPAASPRHPPAGATTLIISLVIVTRPFHLLVIEIAVAIPTLQAIAINRLAGID